MKNGLAECPDLSVQLSRERFLLCMEAVWELAAIADGSKWFLRAIDDGSTAGLMLRALNSRMRILTSSLVSGLSAPVADVPTLQKALMLSVSREGLHNYR